ncbi:hypothetical protein [Streptomyces atratus]|uniref:hypothetical protein n=1 Tax=Streptomyces atratus TaxID=1893 RepID=UPI002259C50B|nr:hypothetical protein [Streptomyces atratus]MCX5340780.1 hypothetical protein [Streptomyces atratus]
MRRAHGAVGLVGAAVLLLGGCDVLNTDKTPDRVRNGTSELDLTVTGRPTPGSLSITEHVLARLKARDVDGLADLAAKDGGSKDDAKHWVTRWGKAAQRPVTAHFLLGEHESTVDVRFTGERATLSLLLKDNSYDDKYGVVLSAID